MVQVQRQPETRDAALVRLAAEARRREIHILVEPISGEHFATSSSDPSQLYRLTHYSCSCRGFAHHQRCTHYALLLDCLGWLPESPTPPTPAVARVPEVPCDRCDGHGWGYSGGSAAWTCHTCSGTGVEPATVLAA